MHFKPYNGSCITKIWCLLQRRVGNLTEWSPPSLFLILIHFGNKQSVLAPNEKDVTTVCRDNLYYNTFGPNQLPCVPDHLASHIPLEEPFEHGHAAWGYSKVLILQVLFERVQLFVVGKRGIV